MFLFAQRRTRGRSGRKKQKKKKLAKKRKNNDTLWHAFVININELRNEPRRIEDKAMQGQSRAGQSTHTPMEREGGACQYCMHTIYTHHIQ